MARGLLKHWPGGRNSPVLCLLLLMVAAVAYWSPLPKPESETTPAATGIVALLSPQSAPEAPPLLLKIGETGLKIGLATPHLANAEETRDCREQGRGFFCDAISEPTVDLPPDTLVKVIDRIELRERVTGGFGQVTWYQVEAIKPDGTAVPGADGRVITGWAQSQVFLPASR